MKILVTTASWKAALTALESLGKRGHEITLIDSDPYSAGFHSQYCHEGLVSPDERDKEHYVPFILNVIKGKTYDLLVPISDLCVEYFSEIREEINKNVRMQLPSQDLIDLARNKDKTYRFALKHGIPIPQTYFPQSFEDVKNLGEKIAFPVVVKRAKGTANKGNTYINNKLELLNYYTGKTIHEEWPVIQEFIERDLYGFTAVCFEGEIIDCFMFYCKHEYSLGGTAPYSHSIFKEELFELANRLIKTLNWTGAIDLDYLGHGRGEYKLLEINPRFSGTSYFAYKCGVDLPRKYYELIFDQLTRPFQRTRYRDGLTFRCILPQEIILCLHNKKHFLRFFKNFFNTKLITDINMYDPHLVFWLMKHSWWYWKDQRHKKIDRGVECHEQKVTAEDHLTFARTDR